MLSGPGLIGYRAFLTRAAHVNPCQFPNMTTKQKDKRITLKDSEIAL